MTKKKYKYCTEIDVLVSDLKIPLSDFIKEIEKTNRHYYTEMNATKKKIIHYTLEKENRTPIMITLKLLCPDTFGNSNYLRDLVLKFAKKQLDFRYYSN